MATFRDLCPEQTFYYDSDACKRARQGPHYSCNKTGGCEFLELGEAKNRADADQKAGASGDKRPGSGVVTRLMRRWHSL